jgi:hypothetical protein
MLFWFDYTGKESGNQAKGGALFFVGKADCFFVEFTGHFGYLYPSASEGIVLSGEK